MKNENTVGMSIAAVHHAAGVLMLPKIHRVLNLVLATPQDWREGTTGQEANF